MSNSTSIITPADLLADPNFARLAWKAARDGKKFTRELLAHGPRPVVLAAVSQVREKVDAEKAEKEAEAARRLAAAEAQREREQPTREAVLVAYESCGYRTATQGHTAQVRIGGCAGVDSSMVRAGKYSSRCTFQKQESVHTLTVRENWLATVHVLGLATFKGQLVLDARLLAVGEWGLHLALLTVRQGRGTGLETDSIQVMRERDGSVRAIPDRGGVLLPRDFPVRDYLADHGWTDEELTGIPTTL